MGGLSGNEAMLPAYQLRSRRCEAHFPRKSATALLPAMREGPGCQGKGLNPYFSSAIDWRL